MKKPLYPERVCYAWGELGNVSNQPPAHNEKGHVWKVRVVDERVPAAHTVAAKLVTAMRGLKELNGLSDVALAAFVRAATGMHVEFHEGEAWVRLGDPVPHTWKVGDKFTIPSVYTDPRVYRVHSVRGHKITYVWDVRDERPPKHALIHEDVDNTRNWRLHESS